MAWLPTLGIPLSRRESVLLVLSVLQLLLVVIDLCIMGSAADGMKSGLHFISIPGKLVYNIVAVRESLPPRVHGLTCLECLTRLSSLSLSYLS